MKRPASHQCFVEIAKEVEASEEPKDFERAFKRITGNESSTPKQFQ